jgi:hypothetical protein
VRIGVCGTDLYFILYSSGIFDWSECCVTQNHAITLVGYDTDPDTGVNYWIALNRYRYFVCCSVVIFVFPCLFVFVRVWLTMVVYCNVRRWCCAVLYVAGGQTGARMATLRLKGTCSSVSVCC